MSAAAGLAEPELNTLLRRCDWRFAAAGRAPAQLCALGRSAGAQAAALPLVHDRVAPLAELPPGSADRGVGDGDRELAALARVLAPGGVCMAEFARAGRGVNGPMSALARAGFRVVGCYWTWPAIGRGAPNFWLPLESEEAVAHLLAARPELGSPIELLARRIRDSGWRLQREMGMLGPVFALGRAPLPQADDPANTSALTALAEACGVADNADRMCWLLLAPGRRSTSKVVALAFAPRQPLPVLAVKIARTPVADLGLEREASSLARLARDAPTVERVPRALGSGRVDGRQALAQTYVAGTSLSALVERRSYSELALCAAEWLVGLVASRPLDRGWRTRLLEAPLARFGEAYAQVLVPGELEESARRLARLQSLPAAIEQRDFAPWNTARARDGALVVYDWESARFDGLPLLDLVYFLSFAAFIVDGALDSGRIEASHEALLRSESAVAQGAASAVALYIHRVGLSADLVAPLRLLAWISHAEGEHERIVADAGGRPDPAVLREAIFFRLWRSELGHREPT